MIRAAAMAAVALALAAGPARAERLTIAVSTPEVKIDANFTGINLTVFGVVAVDGATPPPGTYRVAVLIAGPSETVVVRKKERIVAIWANRGAETIIRPPSFYDLAATGPLTSLAAAPVLDQLGLGFENIPFTYEGRGIVNDPSLAEFRQAYIRLKQKQGLFNQDIGVTFIGDLIFRATIRLPANTPVGHYTAIAYLFNGNELIAHAQDSIEVSTTGFEATMTTFAHSQALVYGILCAGLALFVGWLGGVIFRRD